MIDEKTSVHRPVDGESRPTGTRRVGLFMLAFGSGFAILTIEIAGARVIAPAFGLSAVPWTAVIGVILAAIAMGSHIGGRLADTGTVPLSTVLTAAAFAAGLPILGAELPSVAFSLLGFIAGSVASAVVLFAPAVLCLGAVVPYLIQADTDSLGSVGRRAGDVGAAATTGSIAGAFVTGFVLLPVFPLPMLLGITAAGLLVMAAASGRILGNRTRAGPAALGAVALVSLGLAASRLPDEMLYRKQTLYASVEVIESVRGGRSVRQLRQNGGSSSAEYTDTWDPAHDYVDASGLIFEPIIDRVESMLVLGGAALSLPAAFSRWRPKMQIDVVEIDPVVTELASKYFAYGRSEYPNISVWHEDARLFLRSTDTQYDLVYLDVFDHLLSIPWTVVTVEALTEMANTLEPEGILAANLLGPLDGPGVAFLERCQSTVAKVFPSYVVYRVQPDRNLAMVQNLLVVASRDPEALPLTDWPIAQTRASGRPLTDGWAPVEYLQAKVFLPQRGWW